MYCDLKEIVTESFALADMTAITSAVFFRSESKGSSFHANERPQVRKNFKSYEEKLSVEYCAKKLSESFR